MTTTRVIGTWLQLSHPRMLFGSVCLYLKTCSVKAIQTCSESLPGKIIAISVAVFVDVNGLPFYWIRLLYDNRVFDVIVIAFNHFMAVRYKDFGHMQC